jgi:hypothetical protein
LVKFYSDGTVGMAQIRTIGTLRVVYWWSKLFGI